MSDPTAKPVVERLYREAIHGRSVAATFARRTPITKAQFKLLVEKSVAEYHATPKPFPSGAGGSPDRLRCKAAAEHLEQHVVRSISILEHPDDDA